MSNIFVGEESWLDAPEFGSDCFNAFVLELAEDVTGSCMIPMNLPKKEVQNIVKRAKKWFYKNYEYSVKESFVVFVVCAIGLGSIVVLVLGTIYKILTGQKL